MRDFQNGLYIVSTPIGNHLDITLYALECLKKAHYILCEDTRKTDFLLKQYDVSGKKLLIYNEHTTEKDALHFANLARENIVALVSDAGTPLICDPGYTMHKRAKIEGIKIFVVTGACALVASAVLCGINIHNLLFLGFFQKDTKMDTQYTNAMYVAPHDIINLLEKLYLFEEKYAVEINIAREVTKVFEESLHFVNIRSAISHFEVNPPRGEFTVFVNFAKKSTNLESEIQAILHEIPNWEAMPVKSLVKFLNKHFIKDASSKEVYNILIQYNKL